MSLDKIYAVLTALRQLYKLDKMQKEHCGQAAAISTLENAVKTVSRGLWGCASAGRMLAEQASRRTWIQILRATEEVRCHCGCLYPSTWKMDTREFLELTGLKKWSQVQWQHVYKKKKEGRKRQTGGTLVTAQPAAKEEYNRGRKTPNINSWPSTYVCIQACIHTSLVLGIFNHACNSSIIQ